MNDIAKKIRALINRQSWVVGGQNFDEDMHFSSLYIRSSTRKYLGKRAKTRYNTIIATYQNFNEKYYIPKSECEKVARHLLDKIKRQPDRMKDIIEEIYRRCTELSNVFNEFDICHDFSQLSHIEMMQLYKKHYIAHWRLYKVARIPEALDRGAEIFTNYLKSYLKKKCKTENLVEINELFYILTSPVRPSVFQEEFFELAEIVRAIESIPSQKDLFQSGDKRLMLKANPIILKKINNHREKWGFLEYHGYGYRKLPDLEHYITRINAHMTHRSPWKNRDEYAKLANTILNEQKELYSKYDIDKIHQKIFATYSEIGLAKLFRRFVQLKNFFFLDKLIHQIALRTNYEEGLIRCLLPEEIENLMCNKLSIDDNIRNRMEFVVYVINDRKENLLSGVEYRWIKENLDRKIKPLNINENELRGMPVSLGYVKGICKVIIRPQDAILKSFRNGEIIVSESTDPDLTDLIARAGGVVTQQGGVTCHAAIICRELGKPAVVGVQNIINNVKDYDEVILDAYAGKVQILRRSL